MKAPDVLFAAGAVSLLTGLALVDYRLSMVVGGAAAMLYAYLWSAAELQRRRAHTDQGDPGA